VNADERVRKKAIASVVSSERGATRCQHAKGSAAFSVDFSHWQLPWRREATKSKYPGASELTIP